MEAQTKAARPQQPSFAATSATLLLCKFAYGSAPGPDGEYASCRRKRLTMQRRATNQAAPVALPPIVNMVLRLPSQPHVYRILPWPNSEHFVRVFRKECNQ
jgi:hypothetical protein